MAPIQSKPFSAEELKGLDQYETEFPRQIAAALKWVYKVHGWGGKDVEKMIPGMKAELWRKYGQPSHPKNRSLHAVAALSWVSQVSMSAILYGDRIAQYWPTASREKIEIFIYAGLMGNNEFEYFVHQLMELECLPHSNKNAFLESLANIKVYPDARYLAPYPLDLEEFGADYYRSIAITIKAFRVSQGFSVSDMALGLNLSEKQYMAIENEDNPPKTLNLLLAPRLKLAFKIPNTVPFLSKMTKFHGFELARNIQQERELLLLSMLHNAVPQDLTVISQIAKQLAGIRSLFLSISE